MGTAGVPKFCSVEFCSTGSLQSTISDLLDRIFLLKLEPANA